MGRNARTAGAAAGGDGTGGTQLMGSTLRMARTMSLATKSARFHPDAL
jgi:hypothetical protein